MVVYHFANERYKQLLADSSSVKYKNAAFKAQIETLLGGKGLWVNLILPRKLRL